MQMRKSLVVGMVIASFWVATGFIQPVWGADEGRAGRGSMLLRLLHKVGLTDTQRAQIKDILAAHHPTFQSLRRQLQTIREEVADKLLGPGTVQEADLQPLAQEASRLQEQLRQEWFKVMLEVRDILTPQQLAQAAQLKDQLRALHREIHALLDQQP